MKKLLSITILAIMALSTLAMGCNVGRTIRDVSDNDDDMVEIFIQVVENAREKGLPNNAYPIEYFNESPFELGERLVTEEDVDKSCIRTSQSNYYFFVQSLKSNDEGHYIAIWMYDEEKGHVNRAFIQNESNCGDLNVMKIEMVEGVREDERIPILVLGCRESTPTAYASYSTIFLHPSSGRTKLLEDEVLVKIFTPVQNMIPGRLWKQPKEYIITSTTNCTTEELPRTIGKESYREKIHLTPILKIYTTLGELVKTIKLPEDVIEDEM